MVSAVRVAWRALRDLYDDMFMLMGVNAFAVLMCLPVVTLPPALAGAAFVTFRTAHGLPFAPRDFWIGFRECFWHAWKLALPSLVGWFLVVINLLFYYNQPNPYWRLVTIIWVYVGFVWLALQFYLFPLLIYQNDKSVKAIFRNAAVLAVSKPLFNLALLAVVLLLAAVMALSGVLAVLLLIVFVSLTASVALRFLVEPEGWDRRMLDEEEEQAEQKRR